MIGWTNKRNMGGGKMRKALRNPEEHHGQPH